MNPELFLPLLDPDTGANPVAAATPPATPDPAAATPPAADPPYVPAAPSVPAPNDNELLALESQRMLAAQVADLQTQLAAVKASASLAPAAAQPKPVSFDPDALAADPALAKVVELENQVKGISGQINSISDYFRKQDEARARADAQARANEIRAAAIQQTDAWVTDTVIKGDPELAGTDPRSKFLATQLKKDAATWMRTSFQPTDDPVKVRSQMAQFQQLVAGRIKELKADLPPFQATPKEIAQTLNTAATNNLSAPSTPAPAPASSPPAKMPSGASLEQATLHINKRYHEILKARGVDTLSR